MWVVTYSTPIIYFFVRLAPPKVFVTFETINLFTIRDFLNSAAKWYFLRVTLFLSRQAIPAITGLNLRYEDHSAQGRSPA